MLQKPGVYNVAQTNGFCESLYSGGFFETIGVNESMHHEFVVFPNPYKDQLTIVTDGTPMRYELFALDGRLVQTGLLSNKTETVYWKDIEMGIYALRLSFESGKMQEQIHVIIQE